MSTRFGTIVLDERATPGTASVIVSLEDASIADASSVRLAEAVLPATTIVPGGRIPFDIEADDDLPVGVIVRVHVDYAGDRELDRGDLYSTISIPAEVLGDSPDRRGEVPVAVI
ncbi:hypothetical protein [Agromyces allii]|uniref:Uncharacterized protein n=1 Tax=Agromyces allii TaxID=393607 RepID=A0ABN2QWS9_9MICO|nr:hypothetical protein [Agromyces allii]